MTKVSDLNIGENTELDEEVVDSFGKDNEFSKMVEDLLFLRNQKE